MKKVKKDLEACRRRGICPDQVASEELLRFKLERLEDQVDMYWKQRAHVRWLQEGDRNTSFFHAVCKERKSRNRVGRLRREDGSWVEDEEEKRRFTANYFLDLFRSSGGQTSQQILNAVEVKVTDSMNESLLKEFTADEVRRALDNISDLKAPGPDGMPTIFYKNY